MFGQLRLPGGGFDPSGSGLLIGNLCLASFLRSRRHCSWLLAFLLLKLLDESAFRSSQLSAALVL